MHFNGKKGTQYTNLDLKPVSACSAQVRLSQLSTSRRAESEAQLTRKMIDTGMMAVSLSQTWPKSKQNLHVISVKLATAVEEPLSQFGTGIGLPRCVHSPNLRASPTGRTSRVIVGVIGTGVHIQSEAYRSISSTCYYGDPN